MKIMALVCAKQPPNCTLSKMWTDVLNRGGSRPQPPAVLKNKPVQQLMQKKAEIIQDTVPGDTHAAQRTQTRPFPNVRTQTGKTDIKPFYPPEKKKKIIRGGSQ